MHQQLQSSLMNQPCLLTVTVRLSAGQQECAARPWPLQSRCGRLLDGFPLPLSVCLSVSLTPLHTHTGSVQSAIRQEHTVTEASHLAAISPHKTPVQQCVRGSHHCLICFKHTIRLSECVPILCLSTQGSTVQICSLWMTCWRRRLCYYGYHGLDLGSILQMQLVMFPSLFSL